LEGFFVSDLIVDAEFNHCSIESKFEIDNSNN
jgi:hypothetical protein